jgi:flagellar biosynthesis protein FlhG
MDLIRKVDLAERLVRGVDQAAGLRRLFGRPARPLIAISSVLGTNDRLAALTSTADDLANNGYAVSIIDEYSAPGNIATALGVHGRKDLSNFLNGDCTLAEIMLNPKPGISVVPASRACRLEPIEVEALRLRENLELLRSEMDMVLVDGISRPSRVLSPVARSADQIVVILSPQGGDVTQAYALIKRIAAERSGPEISVAVARARDKAEAKSVFETLRHVALSHLGLRLHYLGTTLTPDTSSLADALIRIRAKSHANAAMNGSLHQLELLGAEDSVL